MKSKISLLIWHVIFISIILIVSYLQQAKLLTSAHYPFILLLLAIIMIRQFMKIGVDFFSFGYIPISINKKIRASLFLLLRHIILIGFFYLIIFTSKSMLFGKELSDVYLPHIALMADFENKSIFIKYIYMLGIIISVELLFRGILQRSISNLLGDRIKSVYQAIIIQSFIYALFLYNERFISNFSLYDLHLLLYSFLIGVFSGLLVFYSGHRLYPAMLLHIMLFAFN